MAQYNPFYANSYALVIGIDDHVHLRKLETAAHDAEAVGAWLSGAGFRVDALLDGGATRDTILDWFRQIDAITQPDDRVLVYFAGHGASRRVVRGAARVGYLMLHNTLTYTNALSMEDLIGEARFVPAKHVFFALDCCFSGLAIPQAQPEPPRAARSVEALLRAPAVEVLTAGQAGERVGDRLRGSDHSPFTHFLLKGLNGAAAREGAITSDLLATYVMAQVRARRRVYQTPAFYRAPNPDGGDIGRFVFVMPRES